MTISPKRCLTCSDEAVEAVVVSVDDADAVVLASGSTSPERVAIDLVPDTVPGDVLLCHAGIALERVDVTEGTR